MAEKELVVCDTNVLIKLFRNDSSTIVQLKAIEANRLAISTITKAELLLGANKKNLNRTREVLDDFHLLPLNAEASLLFDKLVEQNATSWDSKIIPDLLIAATAMAHGASLYTLNQKDFKNIDGLKLYAVS